MNALLSWRNISLPKRVPAASRAESDPLSPSPGPRGWARAHVFRAGCFFPWLGSRGARRRDGPCYQPPDPTDHPPLLLNGKKPPYLRFVCHLCYGPEKMLSQQTLPICNVSRNCSIITSSWRLPGAARCSLPGGVSPQGHHGKLDKDHRRGCSSGSRQNAGAAPGSTRFPPTFSRPDASYQEPRHEVKT